MFTGVVDYMIGPVSLIFCGQLLGETEMAAAGLAISIFHTAGLSIIMGLLTTCETLFTQVSIMEFRKCIVLFVTSTNVGIN